MTNGGDQSKEEKGTSYHTDWNTRAFGMDAFRIADWLKHAEIYTET